MFIGFFRGSKLLIYIEIWKASLCEVIFTHFC